MLEAIKKIFSSKPSLLTSKEPVVPRKPQLAPPLNYFTMDVISTNGDYDDNSFYNDLEKIEKRYEIPKDYEEIK